MSSGVTVNADVHVPYATVAVARGGKLAGKVVAREFLLEDGKGGERLTVPLTVPLLTTVPLLLVVCCGWCCCVGRVSGGCP